MRCPRCGLTVTVRAAYLTLDRCPRCIAKAHIAISMEMVDQQPAQRLTTAARVGPEPSRLDAHRQAAPGELVIRAERDSGVVTLALTGELDLASAPMLDQRLQEAGQAIGIGRVVVDLSGLEFFDSAGLHVLLNAHRRLREHGQGLVLRRGPKGVHRLFELSHTASVFRFEN